MGETVSAERVSERLETALQNNELPLSAQKTAFQLLNRLRSSTKVAVMGSRPDEVIKLINALAGFRAIPEDANLPAVEISFGPREKTSCMVGENVLSTRDGLIFDDHLDRDVDLLRFETPKIRFRTITLVSCPLIGAQQIKANALKKIQNRVDVALWCTRDFDGEEQALWGNVKDSLKDNSYLVLSNAENLVARKELNQRLSQLGQIASAEFFRMFVIGLNTAVSSLRTSDETSQKIWKASGAEVLEKTLSKRVLSGQSADRDHTLLFLSKYGLNTDVKAAPKPQTKIATQPETGIDAPVLDNSALEILQTGAQDLLSTLDFIGSKASADILEHCLQITNAAIERLMESPDQGGGSGSLLKDLMEVADMLILMQLERDEDAAADAVTLLLQLKQGIEFKQAA